MEALYLLGVIISGVTSPLILVKATLTLLTTHEPSS